MWGADERGRGRAGRGRGDSGDNLLRRDRLDATYRHCFRDGLHRLGGANAAAGRGDGSQGASVKGGRYIFAASMAVISIAVMVTFVVAVTSAMVLACLPLEISTGIWSFYLHELLLKPLKTPPGSPDPNHRVLRPFPDLNNGIRILPPSKVTLPNSLGAGRYYVDSRGGWWQLPAQHRERQLDGRP